MVARTHHKRTATTYSQEHSRLQNRHAPLRPSILKRAEIIHINPTSILARPTIEIQREVTRLQKKLWTTQKSSAEARMEWLTKIAQDQSQAEGNPDRKTKMKQMLKDAKTHRSHKRDVQTLQQYPNPNP